MMKLSEVYVGLGGNVGDSVALLCSALHQIASADGIYDLEASSFYQTSPVSDEEQPDYINAVCRFKTTHTIFRIWDVMQQIEIAHGKILKPKNAPRPLDLDILFFGNERFRTQELEIPHPRWQERLFVLVPLAELVDTISLPASDHPIYLKDLINVLSCQLKDREAVKKLESWQFLMKFYADFQISSPIKTSQVPLWEEMKF